MNATVKKILFGAGVLLAVSGIVAYNKIQKLKRVFDKLEIKPVGARNIKLSFKQITFVTDILFTNPTNEDFDVAGYVASLVRLNFFYDNVYIATAKPVVNEISIPAKNQLLFKNLPVVLPTLNVLQNSTSLIDFKFDKLTVEAVINVAGNEYFIKA